MKKLFSLSELSNTTKPAQLEPESQDKAEIHRTKFLNKHLAKIDSLKSLMGKYPAPGEAFFLYTLNSFNAFTFIVYVIKHSGIIDELSFSTYSINERILASLIKWYDKGAIKRVNLSISDSIRHRMPKVYDLLQLQAQNRDITINYCWNHSKITLIKSAGNHFVIEGSGNFSENAMHEQYLFLNDASVYNFRLNCLMSLQ